MNKTLFVLAAAITAGAANAIILTQWNFNDETLVPQIGAGTAALIGGTTSTWATGSPNDGGAPNRGWNTSGYPTQGNNSGTAGVRYNVSTAGYMNIRVKWDQRNSNTSSRFFRFDYTTDGGSTWNLGSVTEFTAGGDAWMVFNRDLTGDTSVNNNANFGFRMVTVFEPGTGQYKASNLTSNYSPNGTHRYDLVTVEADVVPEPASIAALGLGLAAIARKRRK
jgi:hypothetical protein